MLKVKSIVILAFGVLLLTGCASEELELTDALNESTEYIPGNSVYKVRLHAHTTATTTRAAIMGDERTAILDSMGVFALAHETQKADETVFPIQWFHGEHNLGACLMNNVAAKMVDGNITWKNAESVYFYPISQFYRYDFYGYYPYTDDLTYADNSVTAHYIIDGTQDIIWGCATSNEDYAYSAKYYRTFGTQSVDPMLDLKHLLTRLTFTVEPGENIDGSGKWGDAEAMKLKSIEICNAYTHLDLLIADRQNFVEKEWNNPDSVARVVLRDNITDTLALVNEDGTELELTQIPLHTAGPLQVGESLMLYPAALYVVKVVLLDDNGVEYVSEIPLMPQNADGKFARANSYKVRIIVHGPHIIEVKGKLTPWNEEDGPTLEL